MEKFENIADDNIEHAFRRGYVVPNDAVNIAFAKAPRLAPKNNVFIVDTSKATSENAPSKYRIKKLAYANSVGILEDENGNQIWDEEYPTISDIFLDGEDDKTYFESEILPFLHVSRHFHVDFAGLAYTGVLEKFDNSSEIKVIDKAGKDFVDENGDKKYRIYLIEAVDLALDEDSRSSVYRVYVFLDCNPEIDELFLTYNKVQLTTSGTIYSQEINYKERVNPRSYFKYTPEESDVIDRSNENEKIFSSKPSNYKEQIVGGPENNVHGWKYFVPKKAIPDPRIFQLFKWRVACEFTRSTESGSSELLSEASSIIKAGVIVLNGQNHRHSRANYLFYQMNETDFNFSKIKFVNPISNPSLTWIRQDQQQASYWHVNLDTISLDDLSKFDVLVWAPAASSSANVSPYLPKIRHFVENVGGTFVFETSSESTFTNLPGEAAVSTALTNIYVTPGSGQATTVSSLRFYDATPDDPNDTFSSFGMWKKWPPNVRDILSAYNDTGSILSSASKIAGWDLDDDEKEDITGYKNIANSKFQYITSYYDTFAPVLEALDVQATPAYQKVLIHQKHNSGGNYFISTSCLFEDHLFHVNGNLAAKSLQVEKISDLSFTYQSLFRTMVSSSKMKAEMKLRLNAMLLATVFKPSPVQNQQAQLANSGNSQSITIFGDWNSSWVINPENGILSEKEKADFNFALLPTGNPEDEPTWQRILSDKSLDDIIQAKIKELDPDQSSSVFQTLADAQKRFFILVTNPLVEVTTTTYLTGTSIPSAWTNAYSPKFEVPYHLGAYVIRDEMIAGTGVGQGRKIYPPKPYDVQASLSYMTTASTANKITATITIDGTYKISQRVPETTETTQIWVPATADRITDVVLHWNGEGGYNTTEAKYQHQAYIQKPVGIDTYTDANYKVLRTNNWTYPGFHGTLSVNGGDRGPLVKMVQQIMNQLVFFKSLPGPYLAEDGVYGSVTANKIRQFQVLRGAQYIDGIIDAETWSLIGFTLVSLSSISGWYEAVPHLRDAANKANFYMRLQQISDDSPNSIYAKQSWESNGPGTIRETFSLKFQDKLSIYLVSVLPWLGNTYTNRIGLDYLDVADDINLYKYQFKNGWPGQIVTQYAVDNQWLHLPIPPKMANSVAFRLVQTGRAGWGAARIIGIRDVAVYAKKYVTGTPGHYIDSTVTIPGGVYETTKDFTFTTTIEMEAGIPYSITPDLGIKIQDTLGRTAYSITLDANSLQISPNRYSTYFNSEIKTSPSGNQYLSVIYNGYNNSITSETFIKGSRFGDGSTSFYVKDTNNNVSPFSRLYGWVNKEDGISLICNSDGTPLGFPSTIPSGANYSTHFARYKMHSYNTDQTLYYGFYDAARKEFVTNSYGEPEISYYDYVRRGPQNMFLAVMTNYEVDGTNNIPGSFDTINRPFKWAMPVYGVTYEPKSKIQLQAPSQDLGVDDFWPVPVKVGSFSKDVTLRPRSEGSYTNYLKDYQGYTVRAHYDVPEAKNAAWSMLYGRPYIDVKGEIPLILDDYTVQVRQYPILISQHPTANPTLADPWYPAFTVFKRASLSSPWEEVSFSEIADYNIWDGSIKLKSKLPSNDSRLVKIDYVSKKGLFQLKHDGTSRVNLNPYIGDTSLQINKPLYVYLLPEYVYDQNYRIISDSVRTRTIQVSYTPDIFNPTKVDFNPLAIQLGVVYITNSFDINDLTIIDTRRRASGVSHSLSDKEAINLQKEASSYWDIQPNYPTSYQSGGFVLIELPVDILDDFTEDEIIQVIERNITAGVRYKIIYGEVVDGALLTEEGNILITEDGLIIIFD